jgi:hypothetical protein
LGEHRSRDDGHNLLGKETGVERPHAPIVSFRSDQRAGVIGDTIHLCQPSRRSLCGRTVEQRPSADKPVSTFFGSQRSVLVFPLGKGPLASFEIQAVGRRVSQPSAEGCAVLCRCLVDGGSEFGWEGN